MTVRIIQGDVREELPNLPEDHFDCIVTSPGTVGLVADRLGRDATLVDLNTSYIDMAINRIRDDSPLFAEVAVE